MIYDYQNFGTSNTDCAYNVAERLTNVINSIGDPILGVKKPEVQPEVLDTQKGVVRWSIYDHQNF